MASGISAVNEVRLRGRVSGPAFERSLPSGDEITLVRVVVPRPAGRAGQQTGARVDSIDCVAWRRDLRRRVAAWQPGDRVEVVGALRRRFWRTGAGVASRYEVELSSARRARPEAAESAS